MNPYLITAALSYLLGSIPFGYLLIRIFKGEDVRTSGSGNIGATNVARKSPALGVATLLLDAAKGLAAVLLSPALFSGPHQQLIMTTAAFFAVLGHLFPVWLKFRGGKGVATGVGVFIALAPLQVALVLVIFAVIVAIWHISLGSIVATAAFPILLYLMKRPPLPIVLGAAGGALIIITMHHANIRRLLNGTENKVGRKKAVGRRP